jgi:hypothetical protein
VPDVPAWLLIVQTAVSGGVGLAGSFIIPRAERAKLANERITAADATMRLKAEEIFKEVERARQINNEANQRRWDIAVNNSPDKVAHDLTVFRSLDRLTGLIATYYPVGMAILRGHADEFQKETLPIQNELMALDDASLEGEVGSQLRTRFVTVATGVNMRTLSRLEVFMVGAVAPHSPIARI